MKELILSQSETLKVPSSFSLKMACGSVEVENFLEGLSLCDWRLTRLSVWHEVSHVLYRAIASVLESFFCPLLPLYSDFFVEIRA